jgi:hypothetical protein
LAPSAAREELTRRLAARAEGVSLFTFLPPDAADPSGWPQARAEGFGGAGAGRVQTFYFVGERPEQDSATLARLAAFDAVVVLSPAQREARIYPCVDPLAGRSGGLDPSVVGTEHAAVATRVRAALLGAARLEAAGAPVPSAAEAALVARARRLRRFFGQPFFVAEAYTKRPGTSVPCAEAVRACAAILDGAYDEIPESAFDFAGGMTRCWLAPCASRLRRLRKKVQMRGGARRPQARRTPSTSSLWPRAPTKRMDLFAQPGRAATGRGGPRGPRAAASRTAPGAGRWAGWS